MRFLVTIEHAYSLVDIENALLRTGSVRSANEAHAIGVCVAKRAPVDFVLIETDEQRAAARCERPGFTVRRKSKNVQRDRSIGAFRSSSMKWTYFETESLDDDDDQHR